MLKVKNPLERAKLVLEHADRMGCKRYLTAKDIVEGSPNLNLAFVAHVFQHRWDTDYLFKLGNYEDKIEFEKRLSYQEHTEWYANYLLSYVGMGYQLKQSRYRFLRCCLMTHRYQEKKGHSDFG